MLQRRRRVRPAVCCTFCWNKPSWMSHAHPEQRCVSTRGPPLSTKTAPSKHKLPLNAPLGSKLLQNNTKWRLLNQRPLWTSRTCSWMLQWRGCGITKSKDQITPSACKAQLRSVLGGLNPVILCFRDALSSVWLKLWAGGKSGIVEQRTVVIKWVRMKQVVWHAMLSSLEVGGEFGDLHFSLDENKCISPRLLLFWEAVALSGLVLKLFVGFLQFKFNIAAFFSPLFFAENRITPPSPHCLRLWSVLPCWVASRTVFCCRDRLLPTDETREGEKLHEKSDFYNLRNHRGCNLRWKLRSGVCKLSCPPECN